MSAEILNNLFRPSLDWSIPTPIIYTAVGIVAGSLLINLVIRLVQYLDNWEKRESRYEQFLQELGITRAERRCLDHCRADLDIKDKYRMLTESDQFESVLEWAEGRHSRKLLIGRIRAKLEAHKRLPPTARRHRHRMHPIPPIARVA
ncbi:MAG: hypothetical protein ABIH23_22765 [bacterium]